MPKHQFKFMPSKDKISAEDETGICLSPNFKLTVKLILSTTSDNI